MRYVFLYLQITRAEPHSELSRQADEITAAHHEKKTHTPRLRNLQKKIFEILKCRK